MAFNPSNAEATYDSQAQPGAPTSPSPSAAEIVPATATLLVSLISLPPEALEATLTNLALAFPSAQHDSRNVLVATPNAGHPVPSSATFGTLRLVSYTPAAPPITTLYLTAADSLTTFKVAQEHQAPACLMLGPEPQTLPPASIRALAAAVLAPASGSPADLP